MTRPAKAVVAALLACVALLALTGCRAAVTTSIHVAGSHTSDLAVSATFKGAAATAIGGDPDMIARLKNVFSSRLDDKPEYTTTPGVVTMSANVTYPDLAGAAGITGIASLTQASTADGATTVTADLAPAADLAAAIRSAVNETPDGNAVALTALKTTVLTIAVTFDGGVVSFSGPEGTRQSGNTVSYTRPLAFSGEMPPLTVTGYPQGNHTFWWVLGFGVAGIAAAVAAVALLHRRRRVNGG